MKALGLGLVIAAIGLTGCNKSSAQLTTAQAQAALDRWAATAGVQQAVDEEVQRRQSVGITVTDAEYEGMKAAVNEHQPVAKVLGVRLLPAESAAVADLDLSRFYWWQQGALRGVQGPGTASFSHFSDGRWMLLAVKWSNGAVSMPASVEVK